MLKRMWPFKRKTQMKEILSRCEDLADAIVRRDMCVLKIFSSTQEELANKDFIRNHQAITDGYKEELSRMLKRMEG